MHFDLIWQNRQNPLEEQEFKQKTCIYTYLYISSEKTFMTSGPGPADIFGFLLSICLPLVKTEVYRIAKTKCSNTLMEKVLLIYSK